jgi:hypothetical protein
MKIKVGICTGQSNLEKFLNEEIDYKGLRPEIVILGISQDRDCYTIIYKDYNEK